VILAQPLGERGSGWSRMLKAGLTSSAMGCCCPSPRTCWWKRILKAGHRGSAQRSKRCGSASDVGSGRSLLSIWLRHRARPANQRRRARPQPPIDPLDELILALFDIAALLFGELRPGLPVPSFITTSILRQIISDPNLFPNRVAGKCLCRPALEPLPFDALPAFPMASCPRHGAVHCTQAP